MVLSQNINFLIKVINRVFRALNLINDTIYLNLDIYIYFIIRNSKKIDKAFFYTALNLKKTH